MIDAHVLNFVTSSLPAPPARVLEVGAGQGELAAALRELGYHVRAIDAAGAAPGVEQIALAELEDPPGSFDAAVAVLSLHHVNPLPESCARLGELIRPRGHLVVDEFDTQRLDERAARWLLEQRGLPKEPGELVDELRGHLHSLSRMRDELSRWFQLSEPVRGAYLYRWELPVALRAVEERLIAEGSLPETGARFTGFRT